jgi:hypothetical protein
VMPEHLALAKFSSEGAQMFKLSSSPDAQDADYLTAPEEPAYDTTPEQIKAPRVRVLPPQVGQCCYPIGEPRTPGFCYCTAPVARTGGVYCLEHKRLCHTTLNIAA